MIEYFLSKETVKVLENSDIENMELFTAFADLTHGIKFFDVMSIEEQEKTIEDYNALYLGEWPTKEVWVTEFLKEKLENLKWYEIEAFRASVDYGRFIEVLEKEGAMYFIELKGECHVFESPYTIIQQ